MNEKKMRVLFLANIPSPYRVDFFNELGRLCDLTVLFERKTSDERDFAWYNNNFNNFKYVFLKGIKINKNNALCFGVRRYLREELFDIIIVGGYSTPTGMLAIATLRKRKIPFILNTDGGMIKKDKKVIYLLKKYLIGSANYWLSTGKNTTEYLINYGANKGHIFVYPFTSLFERDIAQNPILTNIKNLLKLKLNINEEKVILSVGRFIYGKGFDVLLNSCKDISKKIGIYIIGGEATPEFIELKQKLNLTNVHFIGFKSKEELRDYYLASDLFVLPTRGDVWGLVVNEAMASGLPVVTTDKCVAGLELIKDYDNGFIVPVNDINTLSNRINEILGNRKMAVKMEKNSLGTIQQYTIENMASRHIEIFNYILKN